MLCATIPLSSLTSQSWKGRQDYGYLIRYWSWYFGHYLRSIGGFRKLQGWYKWSETSRFHAMHMKHQIIWISTLTSSSTDYSLSRRKRNQAVIFYVLSDSIPYSVLIPADKVVKGIEGFLFHHVRLDRMGLRKPNEKEINFLGKTRTEERE